MSYDLLAFPLRAGESPDAVVERLEKEATELSQPPPAAPEHNRRLAEALRRADPTLHPPIEGVHVELELDGDDVQIALWSECAAIHLPVYPDNLDDLEGRLGAYFRVFHDIANYVLYDPQTEELLDLARGPADVVKALADRG